MRRGRIATVRVAVTQQVIARLHDVHRQANLGALGIHVSEVFPVRRSTARRNHKVARNSAGQHAVLDFGAQITPEEGLSHLSPVILGEDDITYMNVIVLVSVQVVVVVHKSHAVQVLEGLATTRAHVAPVAFQENRAAAVRHGVTGTVLVRSGYFICTTVSRLVRCLLDVCALLAALVPCGKQEILPVVFDKARAFFGSTARAAGTARNVVDRLVVARLVACCSI